MPAMKSVERVEKQMAKQKKQAEEKKAAIAIHKLKNDLVGDVRVSHVVNTIMNAALDDEHKHQAAAWKLLVDRILPQSVFEQEVSTGQARNAIQINISTVGSPQTSVIDGEIIDDE